ncbi:hypothetical protein WAI453_005249 [Rhynchosporium graminicola]
MGYLLYSTVFSLLFISTVLFLTRSLWLNTMLSLPGTSFLYSRLPASFSADIENGLSSSAFDLSGNVAAGDSRRGLDDMSKREIQKIMKSRRVNFDEMGYQETPNSSASRSEQTKQATEPTCEEIKRQSHEKKKCLAKSMPSTKARMAGQHGDHKSLYLLIHLIGFWTRSYLLLQAISETTTVISPLVNPISDFVITPHAEIPRYSHHWTWSRMGGKEFGWIGTGKLGRDSC